MATESAGNPELSDLLKGPMRPLLKQLGQRAEQYLEMPPVGSPTLPEALLRYIRIASWPLASLAVGAVFYLVYVVLAAIEGTLNVSQLWQSLILPAVIVYLLLIQPIIRRLLAHAIDAYVSLVPYNDKFRRLEMRAYSLNRRDEYLAVGLGAIVGLYFLTPPLPGPELSTRLYDYVGEALVFGLVGWHVYSVVVRTRLLSMMYDQVQSLNVFEQSVPYRPLLQWSLGVAACLLGALVVSSFFIPDEVLYSPTVVTIYAAFSISVIIVFVFSRVPASFLSQLRVFRAFVLFLAVALVGTIGFNRFEEWPITDSLYATIITMTTIGYGDFSPETPEGRVFTIFLSLFAIGIGGYAITSIASFVIEGNFHRYIQGRRVDKQIVRLKDHYIVCGAGQMGKQIAIELYKSEVSFVVIELSSDVLDDLMREVDIPYVQGDATHDETLLLAGVERARGLVAALRDDKSNVFIALSARSLNADLHIISRLSQEKNRKKLQKAGVNVIVSPEEVSGRRMVAEMLNSEVVTLLDEMLRAERQTGQTLRLEELHVDEIRAPAFVELLEQDELHIYDIGARTELMVVAIERCERDACDDRYIYSPRGSTKLHPGDILIVISTPEQRAKLMRNVLGENKIKMLVSQISNKLSPV